MKVRNPSPLRYPGGKASITKALEAILYANKLQGCVYVEPFAGGAGAGLKLLSEGHIDRVIINDADKAVSAFWLSVMKDTEEFVERIHITPLSIKEWEKQREIYRSPSKRRRLDLGFATFYLNRCNRSGIIMNGGPIGGIEQAGKWKLDARFNRKELAERVTHLGDYGDRIHVLCKDAGDLMENLNLYLNSERCFVYADPPYYTKGRELYLSHYEDADHAAFAKIMKGLENVSWVMTYDDHDRVTSLYQGERICRFNLRYSAHQKSAEGGEILIAPKRVTIPARALDSLGALGLKMKAA